MSFFPEGNEKCFSTEIQSRSQGHKEINVFIRENTNQYETTCEICSSFKTNETVFIQQFGANNIHPKIFILFSSVIF